VNPQPWRFTLKITSAEVFIGGPGKNYVTLKIMTDQGIYGLGDATLNTRETLPASAQERGHLAIFLSRCIFPPRTHRHGGDWRD